MTSNVRGNTAMFEEAKKAKSTFKRPEYWVLAFGWSLALCSGFVNVCSFKSFAFERSDGSTFRAYGTHVTGSTTWIGRGLANYTLGGDQAKYPGYQTFPNIGVVGSFLFGAFVCGLLIDKNQVNVGKGLYGVALLGNSLMLILSRFTMADHGNVPGLGLCLMAGASGLQNGMCTSHFGAIMRTTHVTGTTTDIGSTFGRMFMLRVRASNRGSAMNMVENAEYVVDKKKLLVLFPMWMFYMLGAMIATFVYAQIEQDAIWIPAGFTLLTGLLYFFFQRNIVDFFTQAAKEEVAEKLEEVVMQLGAESQSLKQLLGNATADEHDTKYSALAMEMERIDASMEQAKDNIKLMMAAYENVEI